MFLVPLVPSVDAQEIVDLPTQVDFDQLTAETANAWAELVLKNIDIEFPNKMSLVYVDASQVKTPKEHFPAFYGCFDWHSSVHGHWVLVRLLRSMPDLPNAPRIRATLNEHLSKENLVHEAAFFERDEHKSFERMYGWAWFLRLAMELEEWDDTDALRWRENLRPLEVVLRQRIDAYLPLLSYPIRVGQHTDTGFALGQLLDYAAALDQPDLSDLVTQTANRFYSGDRRYPVRYEPSGHDFFSSCWNEADLMRRVLPADEFAQWLGDFVPNAKAQLTDGTIEPVEVPDVTDGKLVHLAGLNLNRAWCLRAVANALPVNHELKEPLMTSARRHLQAGMKYVNSGHYEGDHWLATFALYAITEHGLTPGSTLEDAEAGQ
ncbi:DUF2891 domain-containing protein [Aporhodopirellula aestuarii]|uniref:DUF2891 domain-containing protein n=1 Tax=Aporhodopirellula aestuarii TaxID=2950107 RepID=A0ABT0TWP6_9BACT|nr:DUF2891 domain-containing protein [Aporhodopirellula aestuarii]MCM2369046.1 DUF2891 domain-containing protein [Aporhodopirellula aestuarii]